MRPPGDQDDAEPSTGAPLLDPAAVDRATDTWRQGDAIVTTEIPFVLLAAAALPLSTAAVETRAQADPVDDVLEVYTEERGLVVVSQTCDVVRACQERPFVEVAPLVELEADDYREVERGRSLRYAVLPKFADRHLVADLERIMTVEKALLVTKEQHRSAGCTTDAERRTLASTLARRRGRFAFPDDFSAGVAKMLDHVVAKHDKDSALGRFLGGLVDIRGECADWEAEKPEVTILFVFPTLGNVPVDAAQHVDALIERFRPTACFAKPRGQSVNLETMSAARYLASDALEVEYVSMRRKKV